MLKFMINPDSSGKKTFLKTLSLMFTLILFATLPLLANNVSIETVTVVDVDVSSHNADIQFDISWNNSWRTDDLNGDGITNWDAAWVFAKYRVSGEDWAHCTLSSTDGHHTAPEGSTIDAVTDGMGVFIYRSANGSGSNDWNGAQIRWNYGTDGVADDATVDVKVFAIEMCYIPEGSFYLGDGSSSYSFEGTDDNPVQITDAEVTVRQNGTWANAGDATLESGVKVDGDGGICTTGTGAIDNANYPTGYASFYAMKYEISQGQYADFLSMLTDAQDDNRYPGENGNDRHTISGTYGSYSASVDNRACNYLSVVDGMAYADWAGLRPMTELEFEKACRGTQSAVAGEYAWGDATITTTEYTISNDDAYNATVDTVDNDADNGNAAYSTSISVGGPLRCGIFADAFSDRVEAGATYYGIMEMSGSLYERPVTLGNATGRGFEGSHGNGILTSDGFANKEKWPGYSSTKNSDATGSGFRGGNWLHGSANLRVSDRDDGAGSGASRYVNSGFRAVRTP